jgi:hypothetical protein
MNATLTPPSWYWIVCGVALLWMLFGVLAFVMDLMTDEAALQAMSETQRQMYLARPGWLLIAYAVATFSGLAGVVGLLLRKAWAVPMLAVSLVSAIIQFGYVLFGMGALQELGAAATLPLPLVVVTIGAGLLWLATRSRTRGWLA